MDALNFYLMHKPGEEAALSERLVDKIMNLGPVQNLMKSVIPKRLRGLLPTKPCVRLESVGFSGVIPFIAPGPVDAVNGQVVVQAPDMELELTVGTFSLPYNVTATILSTCCRNGSWSAYVNQVNVHFTLKKMYTFDKKNAGWLDKYLGNGIFNVIFGKGFGGSAFLIHNEWDRSVMPIKVKHSCDT